MKSTSQRPFRALEYFGLPTSTYCTESLKKAFPRLRELDPAQLRKSLFEVLCYLVLKFPIHGGKLSHVDHLFQPADVAPHLQI